MQRSCRTVKGVGDNAEISTELLEIIKNYTRRIELFIDGMAPEYIMNSPDKIPTRIRRAVQDFEEYGFGP